jgi:SSS family solute:Na+ symporter
MDLNFFDIGVFLAFIVVVVGFSMFKSRREKTSEDYFLASRGLRWWLIGISIVAANISTEQCVGMAGQGAGGIGLAVSNWQLFGSVGIVIIAFTLLPRFLRAGIYTMPEYLEYRYNSTARAIMALTTVVIYVAVLLTAVLYSGGLTLRTIFGLSMRQGVWLIGVIAAIYTVWGGLKAVAWADLFQGLALLAGGVIIFFLGLHACGGWGQFSAVNSDKLHMVLPAGHEGLPWTGVFSGMWIVLVYYCGLNQFIVQRNLAARTLRDGQLGVIFAGALWVLVPFAIVMPGLMALGLYKADMAAEADKRNAKVLEHYEQTKGVGEELFLYESDGIWKQRFPEKAKELESNNIKVLQRAENLHQKTKVKNLIGYSYDSAFPMLIRNLVPAGLRGFMFAAIAGAVISSLASMLNSASTIFTMDVYNRMFDRNASQRRLLLLGRIMTLAFVAAGCLLAPMLDDPKFGGVFQYIQQFQGYIWPGVVAAFLFGMIVTKAPGAAGVAALVCGPAIYGLLQGVLKERVHFLIQVAITFWLLIIIMGLITFIRPLDKPRELPVREGIETRTAMEVKLAGAAVIAAVAVFYIVFW